MHNPNRGWQVRLAISGAWWNSTLHSPMEQYSFNTRTNGQTWVFIFAYDTCEVQALAANLLQC